MGNNGTNTTFSAAPDIRAFSVVMYSGLMPLVGVVGLTGNVLTLILLIKQQKSSSTRWILFLLTVSDFLFLLVVMLFVLTENFRLYYPELSSRFTPHTFWILRIAQLPSRLSKSATVLLVIERAFAVRRPLTVKEIWTEQRTKQLLILTVVVVTGVNFPSFLPYKRPSYDPESTTYSLALQEMRLYRSIFEKYYTVLSVIFGVLPALSVAVLNVDILRRLRGRNAILNRMSAEYSRLWRVQENRMTKMLLSVSGIYLLTTIPYETLLLIMILDSNNVVAGKDNAAMRVGVMTSYFLMYVNSAVNFLVYVSTNVAYRRQYAALLCPRMIQRRLYSNTVSQIQASSYDFSRSEADPYANANVSADSSYM